MKLRNALCLILILFSVVPLFAKEAVWMQKMKQVKILSHNRDDIRKLLGNPADNKTDDYLWYYDFKQGRMSITYETGTCSENFDGNSKRIGWKVPEWTVVEISFSPDKHINQKKIGINLSGFIKKPISPYPDLTPDDNKRAPFLFEYENEELGIYLFEEYGKFSEITFYPSNQFDFLRCDK